MRSEIEKEIKKFIVEEVLEDTEGTDLPEDIPLLSGLLDSFGLMSLIGFLEDRYKLIIRNDQVVKGNFESVSALAEFIEVKLQEQTEEGDRAAAQGA
jgi:acyl carrier protein